VNLDIAAYWAMDVAIIRSQQVEANEMRSNHEVDATA
jgi:hypothetical protein